MYTTLAQLSLPECGPIYNLDFDTWEFPCGLSVADIVVVRGHGWGPMAAIHKKHHEHCEDYRPWEIMVTEEIGDDFVKRTYKCGC